MCQMNDHRTAQRKLEAERRHNLTVESGVQEASGPIFEPPKKVYKQDSLGEIIQSTFGNIDEVNFEHNSSVGLRLIPADVKSQLPPKKKWENQYNSGPQLPKQSRSDASAQLSKSQSKSPKKSPSKRHKPREESNHDLKKIKNESPSKMRPKHDENRPSPRYSHCGLPNERAPFSSTNPSVIKKTARVRPFNSNYNVDGSDSGIQANTGPSPEALSRQKYQNKLKSNHGKDVTNAFQMNAFQVEEIFKQMEAIKTPGPMLSALPTDSPSNPFSFDKGNSEQDDCHLKKSPYSGASSNVNANHCDENAMFDRAKFHDSQPRLEQRPKVKSKAYENCAPRKSVAEPSSSNSDGSPSEYSGPNDNDVDSASDSSDESNDDDSQSDDDSDVTSDNASSNSIKTEHSPNAESSCNQVTEASGISGKWGLSNFFSDPSPGKHSGGQPVSNNIVTNGIDVCTDTCIDALHIPMMLSPPQDRSSKPHKSKKRKSNHVEPPERKFSNKVKVKNEINSPAPDDIHTEYLKKSIRRSASRSPASAKTSASNKHMTERQMILEVMKESKAAMSSPSTESLSHSSRSIARDTKPSRPDFKHVKFVNNIPSLNVSLDVSMITSRSTRSDGNKEKKRHKKSKPLVPTSNPSSERQDEENKCLRNLNSCDSFDFVDTPRSDVSNSHLEDNSSVMSAKISNENEFYRELEPDLLHEKAREFKQRADHNGGGVRVWDRCMDYAESILYYLLTAHALLKTNEQARGHKLLEGQHRLIDYNQRMIGKQNHDDQPRFKIIYALMCKIRAFRDMQLYKEKKVQASRLCRRLLDHFKHPPSPSHGATPSMTGTPSPLSPTPSPGSQGSVGSSTALMPQRIFNMTDEYVSISRFLVEAFENWDASSALCASSPKLKDFFAEVDKLCGFSVSLSHEPPDFVKYSKTALEILRAKYSSSH